MGKRDRQKRLIRIMADYGLTCQMVGDMLNRTRAAVSMWRNPGNGPTDHALELLEYKLGER